MTVDPVKGEVPRVIWMLWLQGWDNAPPVAQAARASWVRNNPGWVVRALDAGTLADVLPGDIVRRILDHPKPPEALSDQIRLELLHRYGGVWADASVLCARPLDAWLHERMISGFFAFARPGPDRMLSSWFLAAEKGSLIIQRWHAASWAYWAGRAERDQYFWLHTLFALCFAEDAAFRALWDKTPTIPATNPFHFGPEDPRLKLPADSEIERLLSDPPVPVFKLTHKFAEPPPEGALFWRLCAFAHGSEAPPLGLLKDGRTTPLSTRHSNPTQAANGSRHDPGAGCDEIAPSGLAERKRP